MCHRVLLGSVLAVPHHLRQRVIAEKKLSGDVVHKLFAECLAQSFALLLCTHIKPRHGVCDCFTVFVHRHKGYALGAYGYSLDGGKAVSYKDGDKVTIKHGDSDVSKLELRAENAEGVKTYERLEFTYM